MMPVERPFVLETLVFWERVRKLADRGLEATGGPMRKAGDVFDLLDAVCDAFEPELNAGLGLGGLSWEGINQGQCGMINYLEYPLYAPFGA